MIENKYKGILNQSKRKSNIEEKKQLLAKIINYNEFWENKSNFMQKYQGMGTKEKYKIKRILYSSKMSNAKKDKIWGYLNEI